MIGVGDLIFQVKQKLKLKVMSGCCAVNIASVNFAFFIYIETGSIVLFLWTQCGDFFSFKGTLCDTFFVIFQPLLSDFMGDLLSDGKNEMSMSVLIHFDLNFCYRLYL